LIKRLLLAAGILGALAGCGQAVGPGVSSTPNATLQLIEPTTSKPAAPTPPSVVPTPAATAASVVAVATLAAYVPASSTAPPAPHLPTLHRNVVTGPHGLNTLVGDYTDCSGTAEVPHDTAVIDTCHTSAVLFVGHNRGVFTPLLSYVVGDVIAWYDQAGRLHHLRVVAVRNVSSSVFPPALGTYEFQTCLYPTANSSLDRDLDAVEV
jgi:hypothetical protein